MTQIAVHLHDTGVRCTNISGRCVNTGLKRFDKVSEGRTTAGLTISCLLMSTLAGCGGDGGGSAIVAWYRAANGGTIFASIFDTSGARASTVTVNRAPTGTGQGPADGPSVTALDTGRFVVAWNEVGDLKSEVFDGTGARRGDEFTMDYRSYGQPQS